MTAALVIAVTFAYCVMGGYVGWRANVYGREQRWLDPRGSAGVIALFWPIAIPFALGVLVASRPDRRAAKLEERAETIRRRERELGLR